MAKMVAHNFFCLNCGKESLPVYRKEGFQRKKFHRKRMYCFYCKKEINMIEIRTDKEKQEFLNDFACGKYIKEAEESLIFTTEGE